MINYLRNMIYKEIDDYYQINSFCIDENNSIVKFISELNNEKEIKKKLISNKYSLVGNLLYKYKKHVINDIELIKYIVKKQVYELEFVSPKLRNNEQFMIEILDYYWYRISDYEYRYSSYDNMKVVYDNIGMKLKNSVSFLIYLGKKYDYSLDYTIQKHYDKNFIKQWVANVNVYDLKYISEELKNDKDFMLDIVKINWHAILFISKHLQENKIFLLELIKENEKVLEYNQIYDFNDYNFVLTAVKQNGLALRYLPEWYKNDNTIVLEAVKQNEEAIQYASNSLREIIPNLPF